MGFLDRLFGREEPPQPGYGAPRYGAPGPQPGYGTPGPQPGYGTPGPAGPIPAGTPPAADPAQAALERAIAAEAELG